MLFINSCSTDKSTFLTRAFHNTTSHFNGYFNAREIIRETEKNLKEQHVDDYSQLLPIFIYPDEQQSQALYPAMDKVIEKCSEVIERHSIYIRNKEHVKWIDDSYFLIGKARFYKHEYELARETFLYIYQAYKKEPIRYEGLLWLIRTHTEMRNWDEVRKFIEIVEDDKEIENEVVVQDMEADMKTEIFEMPEEEIVEEKIFTIVENMPSYPGCESENSEQAKQNCTSRKIMEYLSKNINYPAMAKDAGIEGRVFLSYVVGTDGKVSDVQILRGVPGGEQLDNEAVRVVKNLPKFNPGKQRGKAVPVRYNLPVNFSLR